MLGRTLDTFHQTVHNIRTIIHIFHGIRVTRTSQSRCRIRHVVTCLPACCSSRAFYSCIVQYATVGTVHLVRNLSKHVRVCGSLNCVPYFLCIHMSVSSLCSAHAWPSGCVCLNASSGWPHVSVGLSLDAVCVEKTHLSAQGVDTSYRRSCCTHIPAMLTRLIRFCCVSQLTSRVCFRHLQPAQPAATPAAPAPAADAGSKASATGAGAGAGAGADQNATPRQVATEMVNLTVDLPAGDKAADMAVDKAESRRTSDSDPVSPQAVWLLLFSAFLFDNHHVQSCHAQDAQHVDRRDGRSSGLLLARRWWMV